MSDNKKEYILCAAIWYTSDEEHSYNPINVDLGRVVTGYRHDRCIYLLHDMGYEMKDKYMVQGFLTSKNRFLDRKEAGKLAYNAKQIDEPNNFLFSEDLY